MILKWLILAVIAWYVLRAARNLMIAIRAERPGIGRGSDASHGIGAARGSRASHGNGASRGKDPESARKKTDVEDARFQDIS